VTSTELFGGTAARPLQVIRVTLAGDGRGPAAGAPVTVRVEGPAVTTPHPAAATVPAPDGQADVEGGVEVAAPYSAGSPVPVTAAAEAGQDRAELTATVNAAETGWTMWMVSHFHYDPVWWSTQGQFTQSRIFLPEADGSLPDTRTAFELVRL